MDLDRSLLWALLVSREHHDRIVGAGILQADCDAPGARKAFGFIADHLKQHDALPTAQAVADLCGVAPEDPGVDPGYVLAEVQRRKLFRAVRDGIEQAHGALRGNDPEMAMRNLQGLVDGVKTAEARPPTTLFSLGPAVLEMYEATARGEVGLPFPWKGMTQMTQGMWPGTLTLFVARPGYGKCTKYDTLVMCSKTGTYKTIEEVVRSRDRVLTRHLDGRVQAVTPDAFLPMGKKECLKFTTHGGRDLSATPEHPVWTVDGWKRMDELHAGDYVSVPRVVPMAEEIIQEDPHEPELIGALLADGSLSRYTIGFTKTDPAIIGRVRDAVEFYHGILRQIPGRKIQFAITRPGGHQGHGSNPISLKLADWGVDRVLSKHKEIPDRVFSYSREALARFLGMLWSCDGSFPTLRMPNRNVIHTAELGLASREMVYQVQRLMLRLGIHGRVRFKPVKLNGKVFSAWIYTVHSTCYRTFREEIPITGDKAATCAMLGDSINPNIDNVPITPQLKDELLRIVNAFNNKERIPRYDRMSAALGMTTRISVNKLYRRNTVSRRIFAAFVEAFDAHHLRPILDCYWDEVERIEPDGVHEVYDLSVGGTHSFVANDLIVHNSTVCVLIPLYVWRETKKRVLIISPEMDKKALAERFFGFYARASLTGIMRGNLGAFEEQRLRQAVADLLHQDGLWIMDASDDITPRGIDAMIRTVKPDLVAVDSLYSIRTSGSRFDRTEAALDWLNTSNKKYGYAAVAFSQQNRTKELSGKLGGGARLGTIAFSDQMGMDAHAVFSLEQTEDDKLDRRMQFLPLKIRRGYSEGPVVCHWDFACCNFEEIVKDRSDAYEDSSFRPGPVPTAATPENTELPF